VAVAYVGGKGVIYGKGRELSEEWQRRLKEELT
jgi:hypothetical protein